MGKYCIYSACKSNDTSRQEALNSVKFYPVPKPTRSIEKCERWLKAIQRPDIIPQLVKKHHFVCEKHFLGGQGPTLCHPDPLPRGTTNSEPQQINADNSSANYNTCAQDLNQASVATVDFYQGSGSVDLDKIEAHTDSIPSAAHTRVIEQQTSARNPSTNYETCVRVSDQTSLDCYQDSESVLVSERINVALSPIRLNSTKDAATSPIFSKNVMSLESLGQEFLNYQVCNWKSMRWSFEPVKEIETPGVELKLLRFKKLSITGNIIMDVSSDMMFAIVPCNNHWPGKENAWSILELDTSKPISSLQDLLTTMSKIDEYTMCEGIKGDLFGHFQTMFLKSSFICQDTQSIRSKKCNIFFEANKTKLCNSCKLTKKVLQQRVRRMKKKVVSKRVKLRFLDKNQLQQRITAQNLKVKALKRKVKSLEFKVKQRFLKDGISFAEEESAEFQDILKQNPFENRTVFQKLLLREQWRILNSNISRPKKWHPAIVQWCLYMKAKSPSSYRSMKQVYPLPSTSTLYQYSKDIATKSGFHEDALVEMRTKINFDELQDHQTYFSLILDEIQIKEDLVFQSHTGELVGFQNLDNFATKINEVENTTEELPLANHILQLMVRGLTVSFKYPYAFFPCKKLTADDIYIIVWEAIKHLQSAGFNILTVVCDKASINQRFIKISTESEKNKHQDKIGYRSTNLFNLDEPVFFVSDVCHLVKTARNCIANSGRLKKQKDGTKKYIRLLAKNGKQILWKHFEQMYHKDSESNLRLASKITYSHVNVNAFSAMSVKLATQTLSTATANAMEELVGESSSETVKLFRLFDKFFDILNVSNLTNGRNKRKPALEPFKSTTDWRFKWLEEEFLKYFEDWEQELETIDVPENLTKEKMMISKETLDGLRITVYSIIGAVKFLLNKGAEFVLTSKFNQDPLRRLYKQADLSKIAR